MFVNKQKKLQSQLAQYRSQVSSCISIFQQAFRQYCNKPDRDTIKKSFEQVHNAESVADDIRREIEVMMYSKALFPESRGDILGLLEAMDRVPNQAESVVRMVLNQHIQTPENLCPLLLELVDLCSRCVEAMLAGAAKLFTDFTTAAAIVGKVDELESEADTLEASLVEQIFSSDIGGFEKILLRDLVKHIAAISDRAENVGDRIRIIVAKRRV